MTFQVPISKQAARLYNSIRGFCLVGLLLASIESSQAQCAPDVVPPTCVAPADVTVSCENFDPSLWAYGVPAVNDNCCLDPDKVYNNQIGLTHSVNYGQFDTLCNRGTLARVFKAFDCAGNSAQCSQKIVVNYVQAYAIKFPDDIILANGGPLGQYGEPTIFQEDCELVALSYSDQVFTNVPGYEIAIERTWTIINWCTYNPVFPVISVPNPQPNAIPGHPSNLLGPIVSAAGTAAPWNPTIVNILPNDPAPTNYATFYQANSNGYSYVQHINIVDYGITSVTGNVYADTLQNCNKDVGEPSLPAWTVKIKGLITGIEQQAVTNSQGDYYFQVPVLDTLVEVSLVTSQNIGQNCPTVYTLPTLSLQQVNQDIPVQLVGSCPLLSVGLSTPIIRRCFPGYYNVQVCNQSYLAVDNVSVEVKLDAFLDYTGSPLTGTPLGNNTYSFNIGTIEGGDCYSFNISYNVNCTAPFGYTHCSEAHVYPDTICEVPDGWSGANIKVSGICEGNQQVKLRISNEGSGDMEEAQEFVVVEDVIMFSEGSFKLNSGQQEEFAFPANGATWRLQAEQANNHPWGGIITVAVEGCGGLNTPGLVNVFSVDDRDPFTSTDCRANVGSYDPNDKQVFPSGYGDFHLTKANTDLEYLIRFQNTGTDTAFTVVVLDTLSQHLDLSTVRPLAASHAYEFGILEGNVIRFKFSNILLPDSFVNEPLSHGFLKFKIAQKADNPDGTVIENSAGIYFDFNEPVITNTVFNTIGDDFILVKVDNPVQTQRIDVYPNPANEVVTFNLKQYSGQFRFTLANAMGQAIRTENVSGPVYLFNRNELPSGIYFFTILMENEQEISGRILLK